MRILPHTYQWAWPYVGALGDMVDVMTWIVVQPFSCIQGHPAMTRNGMFDIHHVTTHLVDGVLLLLCSYFTPVQHSTSFVFAHKCVLGNEIPGNVLMTGAICFDDSEEGTLATL